jgi:hypothetical protein
MCFAPGCHSAKPASKKILFDTELKTLHYHFLTEEYLVRKYKRNKERMSQINIQNYWGHHYRWDEKKVRNFFRNIKKNSKEII